MKSNVSIKALKTFIQSTNQIYYEISNEKTVICDTIFSQNF